MPMLPVTDAIKARQKTGGARRQATSPARREPRLVAERRAGGGRCRALLHPGRGARADREPALHVVDADTRVLHRGALRRPPPVPPQRPLVLARRPAARLRPDLRRVERPDGRQCSLGTVAHAAAGPAAAADQVRLQPRPVRARDLHRGSSWSTTLASVPETLRPAACGRRCSLATQASGILTVLLIGARDLALRGPPCTCERSARCSLMDFVVTPPTRASRSPAAIIVVYRRARAIPLLLVPALTVFLAYRAYLLERQRHERLEFLYEATRTLSRSPEIVQALEGLLGPLARGVPRRDRRDRAVQLRRQPAAAHDPRAGRLPRGDGADRRRDRRRAARRWSTPTAPSVRARAPVRLASACARYLDGRAA